MSDPYWPDEGEWGDWFAPTPDSTFETRLHNQLQLWERRCRWCHTALRDFPPEECKDEGCQGMNVIGGADLQVDKALKEILRINNETRKGKPDDQADVQPGQP